MSPFTFNVIKVLVISGMAFFLALILAPILIRFLNSVKFWKKRAREKALTGERAKVFLTFHSNREVSVPRGGGILIWFTVLFLVFGIYFLAEVLNIQALKGFNFLSRGQTWLIVFTLFSASLIGLLDDILTVYGKGKYLGGGMSLFRRFLLVLLIGAVGGWWFYVKLGWSSIYIPFWGDLEVGIIYPFLFILVMLASWAGGVVDGLDGLAGGVLASIIGALSVIAFSQGKVDLATFGGAIVGSLFAFLWYNIPPAKFYMGETGILALTSVMAVMTFITDSLLVLPLIAGILVLEVGSVLIQLFSKKFLKKKVFLSAPIHHHLEAKGWKSYQITMRFWILSVIFAVLGVAIRMAG